MMDDRFSHQTSISKSFVLRLLLLFFNKSFEVIVGESQGCIVLLLCGAVVGVV